MISGAKCSPNSHYTYLGMQRIMLVNVLCGFSWKWAHHYISSPFNWFNDRVGHRVQNNDKRTSNIQWLNVACAHAKDTSPWYKTSGTECNECIRPSEVKFAQHILDMAASFLNNFTAACVKKYKEGVWSRWLRPMCTSVGFTKMWRNRKDSNIPTHALDDADLLQHLAHLQKEFQQRVLLLSDVLIIHCCRFTARMTIMESSSYPGGIKKRQSFLLKGGHSTLWNCS